MATRNTRHILTNSDIVNRPLPSNLLKGEPIVNTAEGIVFFSGITTSTAEWTPASNANFFEVGSNLYNLKIRNQITHYNGLSNLAGKFLSGTTSGFVLADISSIQGISNDSYVTGFTYDNINLLTIINEGRPNVSVKIQNITLTGLTVNNPSGGTPVQIGQGGMVIGSGGSPSNPGLGDLFIHGNLIVYGTGTTIATNELYVEDPTITLNYNPSGSSTSTSIGSGFVIQDGSGTQGTNTTLQIGQLYGDTNLLSYSEYTSATGNLNRGFFTQLGDIIIRNTNNNSGAPNGVRVLAEGDLLDGGVY